MKGLTKIFAAIFLLQSMFGLACDCSPLKDHDKLIEACFNYYPIVFIGNVVEKDSELWIEVKEVFKGNLQTGQMLKAGFETHSCAYYFGETGMGLFYGYVKEKEFTADLCSPTRMFDRPHLYPPPPPAPPIPDPEYNPEVEKQKNEGL